MGIRRKTAYPMNRRSPQRVRYAPWSFHRLRHRCYAWKSICLGKHSPWFWQCSLSAATRGGQWLHSDIPKPTAMRSTALRLSNRTDFVNSSLRMLRSSAPSNQQASNSCYDRNNTVCKAVIHSYLRCFAEVIRDGPEGWRSYPSCTGYSVFQCCARPMEKWNIRRFEKSQNIL